MPRKNLIRSSEFPYHVTARSNNRELFPVALDFIWKISCEELYLLHLLYGIEVHAFVLMPNHFHLLLSTPNEDLGIVMNQFMSNLTKRVNSLSSKSGHLFGGPYFWTIITSTRYFAHVLKYVYRNPVRSNLNLVAEEYEFSTLSGLFGKTRLEFPLFHTRIGLEVNLPSHEDPRWLEWINRAFPTEAELVLKKALRKRKLKELIHRDTRRPYEELSSFF